VVHLPPDPHILSSFANANLPWWKALAELVDNSLDAGATRVVIDVTDRVLTVSDDGAGCEDITAVFKLGDHKKGKSAKRILGRYGIGAKDAWLSCADTMEVLTRRNRIETSLKVNWTEWMQSNWNVRDPECKATDQPSGTTIKLPLRHGKNSPNDDAYNMLAFVFTPAISRGIQILKPSHGKKKILQPFFMPTRNDVVQAEFDIDGKAVKIDIGILPDGVKLEKGPFWLIYGHRIIDATSLGAGQYSVQRMAGTITIGDGWALSKNKDDLSESRDRLADAIFVRIEHILKKADQLAETIESSVLRGEIEDMLNAAINDASNSKEKRDKGSIVGSVAPKNSGRKRKTAAKIQIGNGSIECDKTKSGRKGGYLLDWADFDPSLIGQFDRSGMRVYLNTSHALIKYAKGSGNRAALTACAVALIAEACCRKDANGKPLLRLSFDDFAHAMGLLVRDYSEEKTDAKAAV